MQSSILFPDALPGVVRRLGIDVVPVGHLALRGVQHGSDSQIFKHPQAQRCASANAMI